MNQQGKQLVLMILAAFVIIAILPPAIMIVFPIADLLMRLILVVIIFTYVRGLLGSTTLSIIIAGVLIYFIVIKHPYISTSIYIVFFVLLMFQFFSVIIWGIGTQVKH